MENLVTGKQLGGLLFNIHEHGRGDKIVYYEEDLLPILKAIGLPEPEWGESISLQDFLSNQGGNDERSVATES